MIKICQHCSTTFNARLNRTKYCSMKCSSQSQSLKASKLRETMQVLSQEVLMSLVSYNQETGEFKRLVTRGKEIAGSLAGYTDHKGYLRIGACGRPHLAHRLAFLYVHGRLPTFQIDHINGDRADNRIRNLREATNAQNACNRRIRKDSKTGMKGVKWVARRRKWEARIQVRGVRKCLGYFETPDLAHEFYLLAADLVHGEFSYGSAR